LEGRGPCRIRGVGFPVDLFRRGEHQGFASAVALRFASAVALDDEAPTVKAKNAKVSWLFGVLFAAACGSANSSGADHGNSVQDTGDSGYADDASADAGGSSGNSGSGNGSDSSSDSTSSDSSGGPPTVDDGSVADSSDGSSCGTESKSTGSQPGFLGDWSPGDYPSDFSGGNYLTISGVTGQMGNARQYAVHVPTGYAKGTPVPVVFCLHSLGETAVEFCLDTGVAWPAKGDKEGFAVIMPNGYMNSWNGGTCCGAAASDGLDDVALMRAIFAEVGTHVNIDLGRVYATGYSNGAYLSYRLACEASDLVVAVAPGEGAVGTAAVGAGAQASDLATCAPTHKVSVLDIHGTSDSFVSYSLQKPSLAILQASDGCSTTTMPATVPPSGGDTTCVTFAGCPTCPNVEVTGCSIMGGGHCWFGSSDCGTSAGAGSAIANLVGNNSNFMQNTDQIWDFFSRHSR
jgi:polyhydroxybutyrate depolymerase